MDIFVIKENFNFYFENSIFGLPNEIQKLVTENWEDNLKDSPSLFNGDVICFKEINKDNEKINFVFNLTNYAHFVASFQNKIPIEFQCRNLHVSALIETADNIFVFAKSGGNSFDSGRYQFIGGGLELCFINNGEINFTECIRNELIEELGIDIKNPECVDSFDKMYFGISKNGRCLSMIFKIKLKITSTELNKILAFHNQKITRRNEEIEVAELFFVNKNNYKENILNAIKNNKNHIASNLYATFDAYFNNNVSNIEDVI